MTAENVELEAAKDAAKEADYARAKSDLRRARRATRTAREGVTAKNATAIARDFRGEAERLDEAAQSLRDEAAIHRRMAHLIETGREPAKRRRRSGT